MRLGRGRISRSGKTLEGVSGVEIYDPPGRAVSKCVEPRSRQDPKARFEELLLAGILIDIDIFLLLSSVRELDPSS